MTNYVLVGDVGGTKSRMALCDVNTGNIFRINSYFNDDYHNLELVISHYLNEQKVTIKNACIAIACPINDDWVEMTNHSWGFSIQSMKNNFTLNTLEIINDFTAVSMTIPMLGKEDVIQLGGNKSIYGKPIAIYGAGTGLGVSHLIKVNNIWISIPGEGGHVDFAPNSEEEDNILSVLRAELGHVSAERVLSGPGLVNLYRAIVKIDGQMPDNLQPKQITEQALANSCKYSRRALSLFCILMGRFGGNLALTMGTFGGVYIAGGIVPRFLDFFRLSGFRTAFEDKGRFKEYLLNIPVYLIRYEYPGLLGAGAHIRQVMGYII